MAKIYDKKITRTTDWGGDASTDNLPVSGKRVQEYIQGELNEKVGDIYLDTGTSRYLCFANADARKEYLNSGDASLLLGEFEAISNYTVDIIDTTTVKSVLASSKNNKLCFKFKVVNNNTQRPTGEAVTVTYTVNNAGNVISFSEEVQPGEDDSDGYTVVEKIMDDYFSIGTNNITIKVVGKSTYAASQIGVTFEMLDLTYSPLFDYAKSWSNARDYVNVSYTINCAKTKYIEWYIDGVKVMDDTEIVDAYNGDTISLDTSDLTPGIHSFQTRAYVKTSTDEKFYGNNFYYTFAIPGGTEPCIMIHKVVEDGTLFTEENPFVLSTTQFENLGFKWSFYDPQSRTLDVVFEYDGKQVTSVKKTNSDNESEFSYKPVFDGTAVLHIYTKDSDGNRINEMDFDVKIDKSSASLSETSSGMMLKLSAIGRSNDEPENERNKWEYIYTTGNKSTKYTTSFHGFEWTARQGWSDNALVISDGAYIEVNIRPMGDGEGEVGDWSKNGKGGTVEIDIETFDVEDDDAVICECTDGGSESASFKITATAASIKSSGSDMLTTRFKDNDRMKLAFIGNPNGSLEDSNLLYIVNNGVLERAVDYSSKDKIVSQATLKIGDINGTGKVKCRLRSIRIYNRAITVDEAFNNYVIDSDDVQAIYEKNDIYKKGSSTEVDYDKIVNKLPVMILTGDLPTIMKLASKDVTAYYDIEYINTKDHTKDFTSFYVKTKLQGTSSLGYPRKNYKINTKNKEANSERFETTDYRFDPETKRLYDKNTGKEIDYSKLTECWTFNNKGEVMKKGRYRFKDGAVKTDKWVLKADYMESSGSHNTGAGRSWNDIFRNVLIPNTNTYKQSAIDVMKGTHSTYNRKEDETRTYVTDEAVISNQANFLCRTEAQKIAQAYGTGEVRTAVDGFPIVMFYRLTHDSNLVFMGQYNFNNDKGTQEVFGFEDIDIEDEDGNKTFVFDGNSVECWEGLKNTHPISLFKSADNFDSQWAETFESRWPDKDDKDVNGRPLYTTEHIKKLCEWVVSTRHEADTVIDSSKTITINGDFARKINDCKYGYPTDVSIDKVPAVYKYAENGTYQDTAENRQKKFETEKWDHFDVWKLAGYYIYLLRYGAVDQFVKNTMLTTEGIGKFGGNYKKWYYINYDNDCLFGLRNNGVLAFDYTLNRDTIDPVYSGYTEEDLAKADIDGRAMMGRQSTLWNNLERDDEFMRMVRTLDDAMHSNGLTYKDMLKVFDEGQTDMWPERIYNANERYKYIQPFAGTADYGGKVNNLFMLQGTRKAHRHWWLSNHMEFYDAKWISGEYKSKILEIKADGESGRTIDIEAASDFYYAWGNNSTLFESNVVLKPGDKYSFVAPIAQVQGDPIRVYAINKIKEIDISSYGAGIQQVNFAKISTETTHELRKVIIGGPVVNIGLKNVDTVANVPNLEYLDITNCNTITNLEVSELPRLTTLKAAGTKLSSFAPGDGSKFDLVELPNTIQSIQLSNVSFSDVIEKSFKYSVNTTLSDVYIKNSKGVDTIYYSTIIRPWLNAIYNSVDTNRLLMYAQLEVNNVNWNFSDISDAYMFKTFKEKAKKFKITGTINLRQYGKLSIDDLAQLQYIFGENCFSSTNDLYIITPTSIFIDANTVDDSIEGDYIDKLVTLSGDKSVVAGNEIVFSSECYPRTASHRPEGNYTIKYSIVNEDGEQISPSRDGAVFEEFIKDGLEYARLTSTEIQTSKDDTFTVRVQLDYTGGLTRTSDVVVKVLDPTYPSTASMFGTTSLYKNNSYDFTVSALTNKGVSANGTYDVVWSVTSTSDGLDYVDMTRSGVDENDKHVFHLYTNNSQPEISSKISVRATIKPLHGSNVVAKKDSVLILNESVIMTSESNPIPMSICAIAWTDGNKDAMTKQQAAAVEDLGTYFSAVTSTSKFSFDELKYFTGLTTISEGAFAGRKIESVTLPETIQTIGKNAFAGCESLKTVNLNDALTSIEEGAFNGCKNLKKLVLPSGISEIKKNTFGGTGFQKMVLNGASDTTNSLVVPGGIYRIDGLAFETGEWARNSASNSLVEINIPRNTRQIGLEFLRGPKTEAIYVDSLNEAFTSLDGVLYSKSYEILYKYPAARNMEFSMYTCELISDYAFYGVKYLDTIEFDETVSIVGKYCFCDSLIKHVDFTNAYKVPTLQLGCFENCQNLEDITFSRSSSLLTTIEANVFKNCNALKSLEIPNRVTDVGVLQKSYTVNANFCENMESLETLVLPDTITGICPNFIVNCPKLTEVRLPKYSKCGTNYTNFNYIYNCKGLKKITLPVFSYYNDGEYVVTFEIDNEGEITTDTATFKSRAEADAFIAETGGELEIVREQENVPNNNSVISNQWCKFTTNCPNFEEYALPEEDNGLVAKVFDGVIYLTAGNVLHRFPEGKSSVEFMEGIGAIDTYAFRDCSKIEEIVLPKTVTYISDYSFFSAVGLKRFNDNGTLSIIPESAFASCTGLTSATFANQDLKTIHPYAFEYCNRLVDLTILSLTIPNLPVKDMTSYGMGLCTAFKNTNSYNMTLYRSKDADNFADDATWNEFFYGHYIVTDTIMNITDIIYVGTSSELTTPYLDELNVPGDTEDTIEEDGITYYKFIVTNVPNNETLTLVDRNDGNTIAAFNIWVTENKYFVEKPMLFMMLASLDDESETTTEAPTEEQVKYDLLNSKINYLMSKMGE